METMTRQEELHSIYWDLYKDAHGIRPRGIDTSNWTEMAFNSEFEYLTTMIQDSTGCKWLLKTRLLMPLRCEYKLLLLAVLGIVRWPCVGSTKQKALTVMTSSCAIWLDYLTGIFVNRLKE